MKKILFLLITFLTPNLFAALHTESIQYKDGKRVLEGFLVYDDAIKEKRPAVLVVHEWWGLNAYVKKRSEQLARLGYVAFAPDMYGKGVLTNDPSDAGRLSGELKGDRAAMRKRAQLGLDVLKKQPQVDSTKLAAMGYCFGGTVALELARSGANLAGAVSFHGGLDTPNPDDAKNVKGKILVLHGGDDKYVPMTAVVALEDEMRNAGVDWQVNIYSKATHGFTNSDNGTDNSKGMSYNADADRRSWDAMKSFFAEIFK